MSEEAVKAAEAAEEAAPTITIAEKEAGGEDLAAITEPTITIAEASSGDNYENKATPVTAEAAPVETPAEPEDVHYQAVEKEGSVTAIWEMQGQKHLRTIDPRSIEGKQILALFETAA